MALILQSGQKSSFSGAKHCKSNSMGARLSLETTGSYFFLLRLVTSTDQRRDRMFGRCQVRNLGGQSSLEINMEAGNLRFTGYSISKELIEAYPEAKVILSTRDVDSWHKSGFDYRLASAKLPTTILPVGSG
jgi:hypothetical protein